jgi:hypothetical protein
MENMRRIIRLIESSEMAYFHGSRRNMAVGTVLKPQGAGYVRGSGLDRGERVPHRRCEAILEKNRPHDAPQRSESVFLVTVPDADLIDKAGGYSDFIYRVNPVGSIWACNLWWYGQLYSLCEDLQKGDMPVAADMAAKYWSASYGDRDSIEYLVREAVIVERL